MGFRSWALAALAMTATSCEADCHDLTEHDFVVQWDEIYAERCSPAGNDWRPTDVEKYCETEGFHACRGAQCLVAFQEADNLCEEWQLPYHDACTEVYDDMFCGAEE